MTDKKKAGAPIGNKNGANNPEKMAFLSSIKKALAEDKLAKRRDRLMDAANQLIDQAAAGESWAIKELADRLDGKAKQQTEITGLDGTPLLNGIEVTFVQRKPS